MIHRIMSFALLLFVVSEGTAQHYGLKFGLNLSDIVITNYINPDAESDYQMKAGLHAGVFASMKVAPKIGLAAELLYSNKGVKAADRINLHYVSLPLLSLYELTDKISLELGPEIGYLITARSRYGNVGNTWNNKLDIGLDAGIRLNVSEKITGVLRYNAGFSSVIDSIDESGSNNVPTGEPIKYQNRVLQVSLHYNIGELEKR